MGILIYLVPAFALWALIATGLAFVRGRQLRAESGELASTQDSLGRYQAALSQLKARAAATTLELESLQRSYAVLKQSLEQHEQNASEQHGGRCRPGDSHGVGAAAGYRQRDRHAVRACGARGT